jgi:hypothetical protein
MEFILVPIETNGLIRYNLGKGIFWGLPWQTNDEDADI